MHEINIQEAAAVGGAGFFGNWAMSQALNAAARYIWQATVSGDVDYSGVAESQGTYYNTVGA